MAKATWEDSCLVINVSSFNYEDKVVFNGDDIIMKPVDGDILEACESVSKGRAHRMPKKICW
jgi:hypothetical protein